MCEFVLYVRLCVRVHQSVTLFFVAHQDVDHLRRCRKALDLNFISQMVEALKSQVCVCVLACMCSCVFVCVIYVAGRAGAKVFVRYAIRRVRPLSRLAKHFANGHRQRLATVLLLCLFAARVAISPSNRFSHTSSSSCVQLCQRSRIANRFARRDPRQRLSVK